MHVPPIRETKDTPIPQSRTQKGTAGIVLTTGAACGEVTLSQEMTFLSVEELHIQLEIKQDNLECVRLKVELEKAMMEHEAELEESPVAQRRECSPAVGRGEGECSQNGDEKAENENGT